MPHPHLAIEFAPDRVAAARWKGNSVDEFTVETLPPAALVPSAVEPNIINASAVKSAMANIVSRLRASDQDVALILPDPVVRVFVQHFDEFPRSAQEAIPMLRWKLKKSIPFDADETVISYMRQPAREKGVDVVTALARLRIVREYEALAEGANVHPGVIVSSSLAAISLLEDKKATLLARLSGVALTTAIVRGGVLCGYHARSYPRTAATSPHKCCWTRFIPWLRITRTLGAKASVRCELPASVLVWWILCRRWSPSF